MSQPGMGVMINELFGAPNGAELIQDAKGRTITHLDLNTEDNALHITLDGELKIKLRDDGQSCCEHRYMRTDDDLLYYIGAKLQNVYIKPGPEETNGEWGDTHEIEFLEIETSKGSFIVANHNEHNGYYGGFYLVAEKED